MYSFYELSGYMMSALLTI